MDTDPASVVRRLVAAKIAQRGLRSSHDDPLDIRNAQQMENPRNLTLEIPDNGENSVRRQANREITPVTTSSDVLVVCCPSVCVSSQLACVETCSMHT